MAPGRGLTREIVGLALPAFATLIAQPLLLMADAAMVARLGTDELAGLGLATSVLGVIIGLSIFLAYGTTAVVARHVGAGDTQGGLARGLDGMVLGLGLGLVIATALSAGAPALLGLYGAEPVVVTQAVRYLRIAAWGLPGTLTMLAATGVLRGLKDTRTPLVVAVTMNLVNIALNYLLIFRAGRGIAGSATGTAVSETIAASVLAWVVLRGARRAGTLFGFHPAGVLDAARSGVWLIVRTASLQAALVAATATAAHTGSIGLASHQLTTTIWSFLTMALDSLAIAAQAMVGTELGAGRIGRARAVTALLSRWGLAFGVVVAGVLVLVRGPLTAVLTPDEAVASTTAAVLVALALSCPMAGIVFVLDGVLIGAGDTRYLALAGVASTLVYLPFALWVDHAHAGVVWLWLAYGTFMLARLVTLGARSRSDRWMRVGT